MLSKPETREVPQTLRLDTNTCSINTRLIQRGNRTLAAQTGAKHNRGIFLGQRTALNF